jgi:putative membrane protein
MNLQILRHRGKLITGLLIIYYTVGMGLFLIPVTRPLFKQLTPLSLIMTFTAVLLMQQQWPGKLILAFFIVFTASLITEMIGVRTGIIFGAYTYGETLGIKILDTPILIGLNWLFLVYCTAAIASRTQLSKTGRILLGAFLMVAYDGVLEYVAPVTGMWYWENPYPGFRNFLMWFLLSLLFHTLFQMLDLNIENKPAGYLFLIQFIFFCGIALQAALAS